MFKQFIRLGPLHQLSQIHNHNVVGKMLYHRKVMCNEQICKPHLLLKILHQIQYLGLYGVKVVSVIAESHEISPAMQWPMAFVYGFMVLGFFLAAVRAIQMIWLHVQHLQERELSTLEQTFRDAAEEAALAREGDD